MHDIEEEMKTEGGIQFHYIPTKKFKTVNMVLRCKAKLDEKTITSRALLPYVMEKGTESHPTEQLLMKELDELYGADLFVNSMKKGNYHILSFRIEIANERFLPNETSMTEKALQLLHEIVFQPHTEAGIFSEKIVQREKSTLKSKIVSVRDDKMAYANMRLMDHMCETEIYHLHKDGYEEDLHAITAKSLFDYYQSMLQQDDIDVYIVGDMDVDQMKNNVTDAFSSISTKTDTILVEDDSPQTTEPKEIMEEQQINQAKLHIGYRTNIKYKDADYAALHVFNGIFGGFPSSKLFIQVREKESLAYYAASRIESHKGLLLVLSGIEAANYKKTKEIINQQMKDMKAGQFKEEEVTNVKELIISDLKETLDHSQGIVELLYQQVIGDKKRLPNDLMEEINQVTKEDVLRVATQIELDTVYVLTNDKGDKENE